MSALVQSWALSQSHFCLPGHHGLTSREKEGWKKITKEKEEWKKFKRKNGKNSQKIL